MGNRRVIINKKEYTIKEKIGEGGFATVHRAKNYEGKEVAIKIFSKKSTDWIKHERYAKREIDIHKDLDHSNIVKLFDYCLHDENKVYLVLELCKYSLYDYFDYKKKEESEKEARVYGSTYLTTLKKKKSPLSEKEVYYIYKQIVEGVKYLHNKLIIHRDLKLNNILLTANNEVKIADFGLAVSLRKVDEVMHTQVGTRKYMSPQVHTGEGYSEKADIFSMGCILYALLVGEPPPDTKEIEYPDFLSQEAKKLLEDMMAKKEEDRITIEKVPDSDFFKKYENSSKSKNSAHRSVDSGNGSRGYLPSSMKGEIYSRPDSGFNSKHSAQSSHRTKISEKKSYNRIPAYSNKRSASEDRKTYNSSRCKNVLKPVNRHERSVSAERDRREQQLCRYQYYASDACQIASSQEWCKNNGSGINSGCKFYQSRNPEPTERCNDPSCRFSNPVLESQHRVSPSTCSHAGCIDIKCSHVSTCCCQSPSYCKNSQLLSSNNPEKLDEHTLEQKISPLNAVRLKPKRYMIKEQNTVLHISKDRQVIVEALKGRKRKVYVSEVFIISTDGQEIKMYNPQRMPLDDDLPPPLPSDLKKIKSYNFQNLPKIYHKWYLMAKLFVDILRSKQPKVTIYGENAKFYWMENSPDPDIKMEFYDGGSVIKRGQKITITNNLGKTCYVYDLAKNLDNDFNSMLEEFQHEKKYCETVLNLLEPYKSTRFPLLMGMPENKSNCSGHKTGKENFRLSRTNLHYS